MNENQYRCPGRELRAKREVENKSLLDICCQTESLSEEVSETAGILFNLYSIRSLCSVSAHLNYSRLREYQSLREYSLGKLNQQYSTNFIDQHCAQHLKDYSGSGLADGISN